MIDEGCAEHFFLLRCVVERDASVMLLRIALNSSLWGLEFFLPAFRMHASKLACSTLGTRMTKGILTLSTTQKNRENPSCKMHSGCEEACNLTKSRRTFPDVRNRLVGRIQYAEAGASAKSPVEAQPSQAVSEVSRRNR